jgi:hypothetical protein
MSLYPTWKDWVTFFSIVSISVGWLAHRKHPKLANGFFILAVVLAVPLAVELISGIWKAFSSIDGK